jgi:hypothetical protein
MDDSRLFEIVAPRAFTLFQKTKNGVPLPVEQRVVWFAAFVNCRNSFSGLVSAS